MKTVRFKYTIIWALIILLLCSFPGNHIPYKSFIDLFSIDKLIHAFIFYILFCFIAKDFSQISTLNASRKILTLAICIVYGGLLEIMQATLFAERAADLLDFIANTTGAIIGYFLYSKTDKLFLENLYRNR